MTERIQSLINALRDELKEYGEMLALLDRQQKSVIDRDADEIFQSVGFIQRQGSTIAQRRASREECARAISLELGQPSDAGFAVLIPLLPAVYRPLVKALVDENNELLIRVQQRARQNHLLLSRSVELMQGLLDTLFPSREMRVYNGRGNMQVHEAAPRPFYQGVG
jgi:flagellar biosynthesis/type III secretory pathway chaperone